MELQPLLQALRHLPVILIGFDARRAALIICEHKDEFISLS
jgi:hypothetical protein